jgi:hypothetical protein
MHLPEFVMLVVATIAAIAAGLAMVASNFRVARGLFWMAALSFGSLGLVWAANSDASLIRQMVVSALIAAIAAAGLAYGLWELRGRRAVAEEIKPAVTAAGNGKNSPNINAGGSVTIGHIGDVINQAPKQRRLDEVQVQKFIAAIRSESREKMGIRIQDGSNEGREYANQVMNLFRHAGFDVIGTDAANTLPGSHHGLVVEVGDPIPNQARAIAAALAVAGIAASIVRGPWPSGTEAYRLVIWPDT